MTLNCKAGLKEGWLLVGLAIVLAGPGCERQSTYTTTVGGVQIMAVLDERGQFSSMIVNGVPTTTIQLKSGRTIIINQARILVDGVEKALLPEKTARVEIRSSGGTIDIYVDGELVPATESSHPPEADSAAAILHRKEPPIASGGTGRP